MSDKITEWTHYKRKLDPSHPLFEEGNIVCCLLTKKYPVEIPTDDISDHRNLQEISCGVAGCTKVLESLNSYEIHYNSAHRNVCSQCKRNFPSPYLLDIHLLEWHDSMFDLLASKTPMFQCLLESCDQKFSNQKARTNHMIKIHKFPSSYRFDRERKASKQKIDISKAAMECDVENNENEKNFQNTSQNARRVFSYKVPKQICFGAGSSIGFQRGQGRGAHKQSKKHWHNTNTTGKTSTNIANVDMKDLTEALTENQ